MSQDVQVGIRLRADAGELKAASGEGTKALGQVQDQARAAGAELKNLTNAQAQVGAELKKLSQSANDSDFSGLGNSIAKEIGRGLGEGVTQARSTLDSLLQDTKAKSIAVSLAIGAAFAAAGAGAIYAAYKVVSSTAGFMAGLFTGESYKSAAAEAIVKQKNDQQSLAERLRITQAEAVATGAALTQLGVSSSTYAGTLDAVDKAVNENVAELDRLGVRYEAANGAALSNIEVLRNAKTVLDQYSEGYHRNAAAAAIGLGTYQQIKEALEVAASSTDEAAERAREYGTVLGEFGAAEAARYEAALKAFNAEINLTSQGIQRAIGDAVMPVLADLAEFFSAGFPTAVRAFRYVIAEVMALFYGLKTVVFIVAEGILAAIQSMASGLVGVFRAIGKAASGDFKGALDELGVGAKAFKDRWGEAFDNVVAQARANRDKIGLAFAFDDPSGTRAAGGTGKFTPPPKDKPAGGSQGISPYETLLLNLEKQRAKLDSELALLANGIAPSRRAAQAETEAAFEFDPRLADESKARRAAALQKARGVDDAASQRQAAQALFDSRETTGRLQAEVDLFKKYGETVKYTEQAVAEFETTKGKLREADADTRTALVEEGRLRDELAQSRDVLAFQKAGELATAELRAQNGLLGQGTLAQTLATEKRRIDLDVRKLSLGMGEKEKAQLLAQAEVFKTDIADAITERYNRERDMYFGLQDASRQYLEDVTNQAQTMRGAFRSVMSSLEDAWIKFAQTGKVSVKDLVNVAIAEVARLQFRQNYAPALSGLVTGAGGWLAGLFGGGAKPAAGADVGGVGAQPYHSGGIVGLDGGATRYLPASTWHGAPRFHGGGVAGEVPAILMEGEEVLTRGDPRHRNNAGGARVVVNLMQAPNTQTEISQTQQPDGSILIEMVQSVITSDLRDNGPITRALGSTLGARRVAMA